MIVDPYAPGQITTVTAIQLIDRLGRIADRMTLAPLDTRQKLYLATNEILVILHSMNTDEFASQRESATLKRDIDLSLDEVKRELEAIAHLGCPRDSPLRRICPGCTAPLQQMDQGGVLHRLGLAKPRKSTCLRCESCSQRYEPALRQLLKLFGSDCF